MARFFLLWLSFFRTTRPLASSEATAYYRPDGKWIRQKSTKKWTHSLLAVPFCLGPPNREPTDCEKRLCVYTSSLPMARHGWRVDKAPGENTHRNACLDALRSPFQQQISSLYGIQCELVNPWKESFNDQIIFLGYSCHRLVLIS